MGLTHTGTNRRYWEQRDKAREIVERLARDAEEYGEYRLAHVSEDDIQILRAALKLPEAKGEE